MEGTSFRVLLEAGLVFGVFSGSLCYLWMPECLPFWPFPVLLGQCTLPEGSVSGVTQVWVPSSEEHLPQACLDA